MKTSQPGPSNDKGPSSQVQSQTIPPQTISAPVKTAGHATAENEWFNIGLSKMEVAMLKNIQAKVWIKPENSTRAQTIRLILQAALAHYDTLASVLFGDAEYCAKEGFETSDLFFERMIESRLEGSGAGIAAIREGQARRRTEPAGAAVADAPAKARAIKETRALAKQPALPAGWQTHGLSDLEAEINTAIGCMNLLAHGLSEIQDQCSSEVVKTAAVGTLELSYRVQTSLQAAFNKAWDYYINLGQLVEGAGSAEAGEGGAK